jgi:hypothetical protein
MKLLFLLSLIFIVGCKHTKKTPKTDVIIISPIGSKSNTVVKVTGNLTRIYSTKKENK